MSPASKTRRKHHSWPCQLLRTRGFSWGRPSPTPRADPLRSRSATGPRVLPTRRSCTPAPGWRPHVRRPHPHLRPRLASSPQQGHSIVGIGCLSSMLGALYTEYSDQKGSPPPGQVAKGPEQVAPRAHEPRHHQRAERDWPGCRTNNVGTRSASVEPHGSVGQPALKVPGNEGDDPLGIDAPPMLRKFVDAPPDVLSRTTDLHRVDRRGEMNDESSRRRPALTLPATGRLGPDCPAQGSDSEADVTGDRPNEPPDDGRRVLLVTNREFGRHPFSTASATKEQPPVRVEDQKESSTLESGLRDQHRTTLHRLLYL